MGKASRLSSPTGRLILASHRLSHSPTQDPEPTTPNQSPWKAWYNTAQWRRLRLATFERDRFTCQMCRKLEGDTSQLVCDHKQPHRGNATKFWNPDNLQTLCKSPCHDQHKQAQEQDSRCHQGTWD